MAGGRNGTWWGWKRRRKLSLRIRTKGLAEEYDVLSMPVFERVLIVLTKSPWAWVLHFLPNSSHLAHSWGCIEHLEKESMYPLQWCYSFRLHLDIRFFRELSDRYGWDEQACEMEWQSARVNPSAMWSKDQFGYEVVSFLKSLSAGSTRDLEHRKAKPCSQIWPMTTNNNLKS